LHFLALPCVPVPVVEGVLFLAFPASGSAQFFTALLAIVRERYVF
jgi:hypothetical protein